MDGMERRQFLSTGLSALIAAVLDGALKEVDGEGLSRKLYTPNYTTDNTLNKNINVWDKSEFLPGVPAGKYYIHLPEIISGYDIEVEKASPNIIPSGKIISNNAIHLVREKDNSSAPDGITAIYSDGLRSITVFYKYTIHFDFFKGTAAGNFSNERGNLCYRSIGPGTIYQCDPLKPGSLPNPNDVNKLFRKSYNLVTKAYGAALSVLKQNNP